MMPFLIKVTQIAGLFKSWFGRREAAQKSDLGAVESSDSARLGPNCVAYAIGDIHGMSDLLDELLQKIHDDRVNFVGDAQLIFLGDMIDRGLESRSVLETIFHLKESKQNAFNVQVLKGNHEHMLLSFIDNPEKNGKYWLQHGGVATLNSFGVHAPQQPGAKQLRYLRDEFVSRLENEKLVWLEQLPLTFTLDDYFFCHASINAAKSLQDQTDADLLWSRRFPRDSDGPMEKIIVHGHEPVPKPLIEKYHINVDTGAYVTGCLTALKLVGNQRQFISVNATQKRTKNVS
jgi:serine/threonine protein phosphatase 1